jgi:hypothetical protein
VAEDDSVAGVLLSGWPVSVDFRFELALLCRVRFSLSDEKEATGEGEIDESTAAWREDSARGVVAASPSEDGSGLASRAMRSEL